jgi:hypothetical protein
LQKILALVFVLLLACGCATVNYTSKAMGVTMNMTKNQVLTLMGPPKRVSARKNNDDLIERFSWWSPKLIGFTPIDNETIATDRVFVRFVNGKVVEWGDTYDFSESIEKSREVQAEMLKNIRSSSQAPSQGASAPKP